MHILPCNLKSNFKGQSTKLTSFPVYKVQTLWSLLDESKCKTSYHSVILIPCQSSAFHTVFIGISWDSCYNADPRWGLRALIPNKFPRAAAAAGSWATFWLIRVWAGVPICWSTELLLLRNWGKLGILKNSEPVTIPFPHHHIWIIQRQGGGETFETHLASSVLISGV